MTRKEERGMMNLKEETGKKSEERRKKKEERGMSEELKGKRTALEYTPVDVTWRDYLPTHVHPKTEILQAPLCTQNHRHQKHTCRNQDLVAVARVAVPSPPLTVGSSIALPL